DYNVTATFFLNKKLFQDEENNAEIIQWMVDHGYDIGNHTMNHPMLSSCTAQEINDEVGQIYDILEGIIPGRYVNIVALPYGDPSDVKGDSKFDRLFNCEYNGRKYTTKATLLCSWTREDSPFIKTFDNTYVKRIRAYDHDGTDFDIEMNFAQLNEGRRYISDGNPDTIVIRKEDKDYLGETYGKTVIEY
ncbi:MAG: polysaccharide deacetylase family protein, partial [Parasporobacterium sp.]|nr:polysaccharide deacetylase family protein [Parasporobacterium sp.]